jgi:transposase
MNAYSFDLRQKIRRACDAGLGSQRAIAQLFGGSQSFSEKLLRRRRTSGTMTALPHGGGRTPTGDPATLAVGRGFVRHQPDAT